MQLQLSGRRDPAVSLAVEGLRAVQTTCADLIGANSAALSRLTGPGSEDGSDRCELVTCADIEHSCLLALGVGSSPNIPSTSNPAADNAPFGSTIQSAVSAVLSSPPSSGRRSSTGEKTAVPASMNNATGLQKLDSVGCAAAFSLGMTSIGRVSHAHAHPVTDIIVLHDDDSMPEGFEKLTHSVSGTYPADLNAPSGPKQLWLAIARFPTAPAITGLVLVAVDQGEFVPPGYTPVKRYVTGRAADLHYGTPNPQLVLCYARQMGAPIVDFGVCFPNGALALSTMVGVTGKGHTAGPTRGPLGGTAASIAAAEANRARMGMFGLGQLTTEIAKGLAKLGPPKEDLPQSYAALSHSLLGADVSLTGGNAKGSAVLCYAKDMTHIDALSNAFDSVTPSETAVSAASMAVKSCFSTSLSMQSSPNLNLSESANQSVQGVLAALTYGSSSSLVVPLSISRKRALLKEKGAPSRFADNHVLNERNAVENLQQRTENTSTSATSKTGSSVGGKALGLSLRSGLKAVGKLFNIAGDEGNSVIKESGSAEEESNSPRVAAASISSSSSSSSLSNITAPTPSSLLSPTATRLFGFGSSRMRHGGSTSDAGSISTPNAYEGGFGSASVVPTLPSGMTLAGLEGVDEVVGSSVRGRTGTDVIEVEENDHDLLDGFDADDVDENGVVVHSRVGTLDSADSAPSLGSRSGSNTALSGLVSSPGEGGGTLRSSKSSPSLASRGSSRPGSPMNNGLSARSRASSGIAISTAIATATIGNAPLRNANQINAADTSILGGVGAGSIDAPSAPAGPSGLPAAQDNEESLRRFVLFRHMSWILSPAASKICVESSRTSTSSADDGLSSFLVPSAASVLLSPLLRALYSRIPELVATALDALTLIIEGGFFTKHIRQSYVSSKPRSSGKVRGSTKSEEMPYSDHLNEAPDSEYDVEEEATLVTAAAWSLLDVVVACAVDASTPLLEQVSESLLPFINAVLVFAGAGSSGSFSKSDHHSGHSTADETAAPPIGLHPATLHRILNAALTSHTFSHQKCIYSERGWLFCARNGKDREANGFELRYRDGRRQAAAALFALKSAVQGIVLSVERDARVPLKHSISAHIRLLFESSSMKSSATDAEPPLRLRRTCLGDYSYLVRAYSAHSTGSSSLCVEMHLSAESHILRRPCHSLPEEVSNVHDAFSLQHRSSSADVVVLFALLSKIAAEPLAFSNESLYSQQSGGSANSSKRLSALLLRDVAIYLLTDAFSVCGSGVAASPLITGCVTRLVCPALLSHALTHRIFHTQLSTSFGSPKQNEEATRAILSVAAEGGSSALQFVLAQGGLATKYSKILSESSASGGEVGVGIALAPPMTVLRAILEVICAMWASRGSDGEIHAGVNPSLNSSFKALHEITPLSIREACAREISALCRALILPVLSSRAAPPAMRIDAVEAFASMVAAPQLLMEMYINHDMFPSTASPYPHMRLLRSTIAALVSTACSQRRNLDINYGVSSEDDGGAPGLDSLNIFSSASERAIVEEQASRNELARQSSLLVSSIMRCLMDSAATVQMSQSSPLGSSGDDADKADIRANWLPNSKSHPALFFGRDNFESEASADNKEIQPQIMSVRALHDAQNKSEEAFFSSIPLMKDKGVRKGIAPLLTNGFVHKSGSGISHFLRLCGADICADTEIGDYLGDEGRSPEDQVLATSTRRELFGGISFSGMPFDAALRIMLTKCGFRLPGEAQKIDRLTSAFATAYCEDNRPNEAIMAEAQTQLDSGKSVTSSQQSVATGDGRLYPTAPDVVEILAFSVIMLNTDAHNPNIKKEKKMTRKQFVNNNRGIDKGGADLPKAFLEFIYDAIVTNEIKMQANPTSANTATSGSTVGLSSSDGSSTCSSEYIIASPPTVEALARSTGTLPLVPFGPLFASSYPETLLAQIPLSPWPTPSPFAFPCEGDGCDGPTDLPVVFRQLNQGVFRMWHHLSACAKSDDRRGAVETPLSPISTSASLNNPPAPAFFPVAYKRSFSITTVTCALEDVWPHVLAMAAILLRLQPPQSEISSSGKAPPPMNSSITTATKAVISAPPPSAPATVTSSSSDIMRTMGIGMGGLIKWKSQTEKAKAADAVPAPAIPEAHVEVVQGNHSGIPIARLSSALGMGDIDVRLAALDALKSATSAAIFLGSYDLAATGCDALLQVEALLLGVECAVQSRDGPVGEAWHATVLSLAKKRSSHQTSSSAPLSSSSGFMGALRGGKSSGPSKQFNEASVDAAVAVSLLHVAVAEMREAATAQAEAATLASTAARFKGELAGLLAGVSGSLNAGARRLLHEGDLIKVASGGRGKQVQYRFFLFTDLLVYAQRSTFSLSDKFVARQAIPLRNMRAVPDPPELTAGQGVPPGLSFMLETSVKPLFLICSSVEDAKDWKRQIREAVAEFHHLEDAEEEEKEEARKPQSTVSAPVPIKSSVPVKTESETQVSEISNVVTVSTKSSPISKEGVISTSPQPNRASGQSQTNRTIPVQYDSLPELKSAFMRAVAVCRPLLSSDSLPPASSTDSLSDKSPTALSDADKLLFYGLFKQAVSGDCPSPKNEDDVSMTTSTNISGEGATLRDSATESALRAKRDAWLTFSGMRRRDAMRKFVQELDSRLPGWRL